MTASIFLLIALPPIGTALGIYGLIVLTTDAARDAFQMGVPDLRAALLQSGVAHVEPLNQKPKRLDFRGNLQWFAVRIAVASLLALLFFSSQHTFLRPAFLGFPAAENSGALIGWSLFVGVAVAIVLRLVGFFRAALLVAVAVAFYLFANSSSLTDFWRRPG